MKGPATYEDYRAAVIALDKQLAIADPYAAATAMAARTRVDEPRDIEKADAREPLWLGGQMALWEKFGNQNISSFTAPTDADLMILLVRTVYLTLTTPDITVLTLADPTQWAAFQTKVAPMITEGLLPQAVMDFWSGLRTPTVYEFDPFPPPSGDDLTSFRSAA